MRPATVTRSSISPGRYARALDTFNAEAYAATSTPDGAFKQTKGHDALFKMIDAFNHPAPPPAGSTAPARTGPPACSTWRPTTMKSSK